MVIAAQKPAWAKTSTADRHGLIHHQPVVPHFADRLLELSEIHGLLNVAVRSQAISLDQVSFLSGCGQDHALHRCQPYAYPVIILAPVEPLEYTEQLVDIPHIEADPVVAHVNHGRLMARDLADLDDGGLAVAGELDRVGQQVHHDMPEKGW